MQAAVFETRGQLYGWTPVKDCPISPAVQLLAQLCGLGPMLLTCSQYHAPDAIIQWIKIVGVGGVTCPCLQLSGLLIIKEINFLHHAFIQSAC